MTKEKDNNFNYIKVLTSSADNIFITDNPEITFFKSVYRRYSNFAIDVINVEFDSNVNYSSFSEIVLPKRGDLLSKIYLEITLPECYFEIKDTEYIDIETYKTTILLFQNFFTINIKKINDYVNTYQSLGILNQWITDINTDYLNFDIYNDISFNETIIHTIEFINSTFNKNYSVSKTYSSNILNINCFDSYTNDIEYELQIILENNKDFYYLLNSVFHKNYLQQFKDNSYNYAWVKNIGYSILDYVDLYIGDLKITRDYGQMMFIDNHITKTKKEVELLDTLTGNIESLTTFNNRKKDEYTIILPLSFWFCQNYSLSLPLSNLNYEDVILRFKFREYKNLAYIEKPNILDISNSIDDEIENRYGNDLFDNSKIKMNLIVEYIYVNTYERRFISQNKYSSIILQKQIYEEVIDNRLYNLKENVKLNIRINNFAHPSKGIIWFMQPTNYFYNYDKFTECKYCDFTIDNKSPFKYSSIYINSNLLIKQNSIYFEYVQPYEHLKSTGLNGVYSYWFSLLPSEIQPTGNINFSKIKELMLTLEFDKNINIQLLDNFIFKCFTINYNILEIENGFVNLLYN